MNDTLDDIDMDEVDAVLKKAKKKENVVKPSISKPTSSFSLKVNRTQEGNPLLKFIKNITWEYADIVPDYEMGATVCALFLSLKYHNLYPDKIHERLKLLGKEYELRVLLVLVDIKDPQHALKDLTRICILADLTLMLAWSSEEAGSILEKYKIYENKPADKIKEKREAMPYLELVQAFTTIKPINKTNALLLIEKYDGLEQLLKISEHQLADLPSFGIKKAKKLHKVLHENFLKS